jgi:hypothetical protein
MPFFIVGIVKERIFRADPSQMGSGSESGSKTRTKMGSESGSEKNSFGSATLYVPSSVPWLPPPHTHKLLYVRNSDECLTDRARLTLLYMCSDGTGDS